MRLDDALAGRTLTRTDFRWPTLATVDLAGANVIRTATYGKHLLTRLAHDREALTLHTHLKMEGSWRTVRAGERWPGPARDVRVALRTDATEAVGFLLGVVELLPTAAEHLITDPLGPDLLDPEHDADEAARRLLADPDRALGEALLDQTVVAGLGTIFVSETCFVAGAHPQAPVARVADATRLLDRAARMLTVAVHEGRPVTTGNRRSPLWVYRRHRQPCLRCGTTIEAGPVGPTDRQRTLYWCPSCQPSTLKSP
jgi:endonuclease-8